MDKVEIIDISPFTQPDDSDDASRARVLKAWTNSFRTLGFAIIIGHGVPQEDTAKMQSDAKKFFQFSIEEKMKSCLQLRYGKAGYTPMGVESVAMSRQDSDKKPPDYVESLYFLEGGGGNDVVPEHPQNLKISLQNYWKHMRDLLALSMKMSALSLGLPRDYFTLYFKEPECTIRLAYYPPQDKV